MSPHPHHRPHPGAEALLDWHAHCVLSRPQPDIAAARGLQRSTVLRRVRRVEALSDCPAWALLLELLSGVTSAPADADALMLAALGQTRPAALVELRAATRHLSAPDALVALARSKAKAALTDTAGTFLAAVPRDAALAWLMQGWVVSDTATGRTLATLRLAPEALPDATPAQTPGRKRGPKPGQRSGETLVTRLHRHAPTAAKAIEASGLAAMTPPDRAARLTAALPPAWAGFVAEVLIPGARLETIEAAHGLPSRSGKAVLGALLDVLAHAETHPEARR